MKEKHRKKTKKDGSDKAKRWPEHRAKAEGKELKEFTEDDVIDHLAERKQSREILSMTNAAVEALHSEQSTRDEIIYIPKQKIPAPEASLSESISVSDELDNEREVLNLPDGSSSSQDVRLVDGSSISDGSFNGVQRVRVSSRLLREIPSPLERSGGVIGDTRLPTSSAAVVIRHADGPSAWVSMATTHPAQCIPTTDHIVRTYGEPTSTTTWPSHIVTEAKDLDAAAAFPEDEALKAPMLVSQHQDVVKPPSLAREPVSTSEDDAAVGREWMSLQAHALPHRTSRQTEAGVLYQGDPETGITTNLHSQRQSEHIKVKSFSLNERERSLKEDFMRRQDRKSAPVKRVVQPTIVSTQATQPSGSSTTQAETTENPVVSAAAIAAAAATAATVPFLQIQHGLETQIGSLVNALQVLQTNQGRSHQEERQEKERELQVEIDARLKRLEEIQKQMLHFQEQQLNSRTIGHDIRPGTSHVMPSMSLEHTHQVPSHQQQAVQSTIDPYYSRSRQSHNVSVPPPPHSLASQTGHPITTHPSMHREAMLSHNASVPPPPHPLASQTQHPITTHPSMHREAMLSHNASVPPPPHPLASQTQHPITTHPSMMPREQILYKDTSDRPRAGHVSSGHETPRRTTRSPDVQRSTRETNQRGTGKPRHMAVKNTKTQTSPQESYWSQDSPLQTPLPRKRPPVPISRSDLLRSQPRDRKYPVGGGERRVHFDDEEDYEYGGSSYSGQTSSKARAILEELLGTRDDRRTQRVVTNPPPTRLQSTQPTQARPGISHPPQQPAPVTVVPSHVTAETRAMLDDLGRISTELKTVMNDAENLKVDLKNKKYEREVETVLSRNYADPSPLDAYLATERKPLSSHSQTLNITQDPAVQHYLDAKKILSDVQARRFNLETNFAAVLRQKDEEYFHTLVDQVLDTEKGADEILHIRKKVDNKIQELTNTVHREIEAESKKSKQTEEVPTQQKPKPTRGIPLRGGGKRNVPSIGGKKPPPRKMPGKENEQELKTTAKRTKVTKTQPPTKPTPKPVPHLTTAPKPAPVSAVARENYLTSVYGRQPYHPQRTTSKAPYLHYQSPVNPKTAAITAALLGTGGRQGPTQGAHLSPHRGDMAEPATRKPQKRPMDSDHFYFHPAADLSHIPAGKGSDIAAPVEGHLVPMAVPLGKPNRDPSLRLPLPSFAAQGDTSVAMDTMISQQPSASTPIFQTPAPTRPNVAVINIQEEGTGEESDHRRKRRKGTDRRKKHLGGLGVQILPTVDIDSYTESSSSVTTPREPTRISSPQQPITRPDESEYDELRNYIAVRDTGADDADKSAEDSADDEEKTRLPTPDNPLTIRGYTHKEQLYHGPAFPPEHPPLPSNPDHGVLEADHRVGEALEDRALEWIEQELLARIVSEMNRPLPDPTAVTRTPDPTPESSIASESDDGGVLAATIGLGGVQLFVDAGLPVDRDLVAQLIKDVVTDQIAATLGYPKPTAATRTPESKVIDEVADSPASTPRGTPLSTPVATPVYTPPESESSGQETPAVPTPDRTPTPSELSSPSEESASIIEEQTPVKETPTVEDEESEVSEVRSPISTPVSTPTGPQTPLAASVSTPEPSVGEPEVSEVGTPASTPQVTVETPTPPPEEPSSVTEPEPSKAETPPPPSVSSVATPPQPEVTASPSSIATSTLSTSEESSTMITTGEDMSEGQLIQPYVHAGQYSEGEYAMAPGVLGLMRDRNFSADFDAGMLGGDEDSRNEMIRTALNGLLKRGRGGEPLARVREERGESSSSETSEPTSMASTLRDTTDIREDSLADAPPSEGEIILPREPSASLLITQMTRPSRPTAEDGSEGEIRSDVIGAQANRRPAGIKPRKESDNASRDISPGELRSVHSNTAIQSPGEISTNRPRRSSSLNNIPTRFMVPRDAAQDNSSVISNPNHEEDTESRSLHTSDLGRTQKARAKKQKPERAPRPRVIAVGGKSDDAAARSQTEESIGAKTEESRAISGLSDRAPAGHSEKSSHEDDVDGASPQALPTRIQVTIPLMDMHDSSANSDGAEPVNEDTFGDVSSISGGDF